MVRIRALFSTSFDEELAQKISKERCNVIRLWCMVRFETNCGLTRSYPAIVDTGAHTSLIPKRIWSSSKIRLLTSHYVKGLIPKEECKMDVRVGEICFYLIDRENITDKYTCLCYFAPMNDIPIILGFREFLSKFKVYFDYPNEAWIEEK